MGDIDFFASTPAPAPAGSTDFVFGAPAPSTPAPAGTDDFFTTPAGAPSATPATPAPASGTAPFFTTTTTPATTTANVPGAGAFSGSDSCGIDDPFSLTSVSASASTGDAAQPVELPKEWNNWTMQAIHKKVRDLVVQNQSTYDDEAEDVYELQRDNVCKTNRLVHVSRNILTNVFHAERTMKDLGDIENSQAEIERKLDALEALMSPFEDNEQSEVSAMRENIFTEARILHQRVYQMSAEIQELGEKLKEASSATNHVEGDNGDVVKCLNVNLDVMTHVHSQTRELNAKLNGKRLRHLLTDE